MSNYQAEIETFLAEWQDSDEQNKKGFIRFFEYLGNQEKCVIEFHQRPGVTYSLRGTSLVDGESKLYVMIDVIEDDPRWLSVCFYGKMISDPEEKGAFVPGGLLGEDAICFDLEECNDQDLAYVEKRIGEAAGKVLS